MYSSVVFLLPSFFHLSFMKRFLSFWLSVLLLVWLVYIGINYYQLFRDGHTATYTPSQELPERISTKELLEQLREVEAQLSTLKANCAEIERCISAKKRQIDAKNKELKELPKRKLVRRCEVKYELYKIKTDYKEIIKKKDELQSNIRNTKVTIRLIKDDIKKELWYICKMIISWEAARCILWDALQQAFKIWIILLILRISTTLFAYYVWAPFAAQFRVTPASGEGKFDWQASSADQHLTLCAAPGHSITVKDQSYVIRYDAENCQKNTIWLLSRKHPLMCWVEDLTVMTRYTPTDSQHPISVSLTNDNPNMYFISIKLSEEPVYIMPSSIVAYTGTLKLKAQWHFLSPAAWLIGRIRFYSATGDGILVLQGIGKLENSTLERESDMKALKMDTLVAAHGNIRLGIYRNETLIPYLMGQADIFDLQLKGKGQAIQTTALPKKTVVATFRDSLLAVIKHFLGL